MRFGKSKVRSHFKAQAYMAPESFEGYSQVKSDIWAIGIITYAPYIENQRGVAWKQGTTMNHPFI